jgi:formylglycine-generating enzyme required for sulfatase activity
VVRSLVENFILSKLIETKIRKLFGGKFPQIVILLADRLKPSNRLFKRFQLTIYSFDNRFIFNQNILMRQYLLLATIIITTILSSFTQKQKIKRHKQLPSYFVEIPKGYVYDKQHMEFTHYVNANPIKDSCEAFYISEGEITNRQYQLYLTSLKQNGHLAAYHKARPDTNVWSEKLAYNEPYKRYYFQHPAYKNYPLVGVTRDQAMNYCKWLTDSLNATNSKVNVTIKLPNRKEWIRAARGDAKQQYYAMEGPHLRNWRGLYLYNHKVVGEQNVYLDQETKEYKVVPRVSMSYTNLDDGALITTEVKSYWPNIFGTYNMCGNVAEMIADDTIALGGSWLDPGYDIRIESEKSATKPSSLIGFRVIAYINLH